MRPNFTIREALPGEFEALGQLMIDVYSQLPGFPGKQELPEYYEMLANIGMFTEKSGTKLVIALSPDGELWGGIVYFASMEHYGSGGKEINIENTSGIRLLAVHTSARGQGIGKGLTRACIQLAKDNRHTQVILHSTRVMQVARAMYEGMGFKRSEDLDFEFHDLSIFGFRLNIHDYA